uniref:Uncharacterized protein n=1 Tax=Melopsittacus undulatus TaxID=13146 RepID=A0A8V5FL00_MELUD
MGKDSLGQLFLQRRMLLVFGTSRCHSSMKGCLMSGSVQGPVGWGLEQGAPVEGVPALGRGWNWMSFKVFENHGSRGTAQPCPRCIAGESVNIPELVLNEGAKEPVAVRAWYNLSF